MRNYLITCDHLRPAACLRIRDLLESWDATNIAGELWGLRTERMPLQIRDLLRLAAGDEASIAIIEVKAGSWWTCHNAEQEGLEWLREEVLA